MALYDPMDFIGWGEISRFCDGEIRCRCQPSVGPMAPDDCRFGYVSRRIAGVKKMFGAEPMFLSRIWTYSQGWEGQHEI